MEFIKLEVERRESSGTRTARKARQTGRVPAVLYGLKRDNAALTIGVEAFEGFLKSGSKLIELRLGDKVQQAILKDIQHDPLTDEILHIDLQRIDEHHEIEAKVPFEFKGIPKGLTEGGVFEPVLTTVVVRCTPARLPKVFLLEVGDLKLNDAIHVKDVKLPEGVKILHHKPEDHVCHCVPQKVQVIETAPAAEGAAPAEPERIGGKKPEEGEEGAAEGKDGKPAAAAAAAPKKEEKKEKK
jgi:large subunit ribosomal protein L25